MEKVYLAVTSLPPKSPTWTCRLNLAPDPKQIGRVHVAADGKEAETEFRVIGSAGGKHLIEARPFTGRTHPIRVHLAESGCAIVGDELYGKADRSALGLRAVGLAYRDPFTLRGIAIRAPVAEFLTAHGFAPDVFRVEFQTVQRPVKPPTPPKPDRIIPDTKQ